MTKNEFVDMILDNFTNEEIKDHFDITADDLEKGKWNYNIEMHYNIIVTEEDYYDPTEEDYYDPTEENYYDTFEDA